MAKRNNPFYNGLDGLSNPLSYMGVNPSTPSLMLLNEVAPISGVNGNVAPIGTWWTMNQAEQLWFLIDNNITDGPTWVQLWPSPGSGLTFAGDTGTAVESGGIINIKAANAALNAGSSVLIAASGNTLQLNVTDASNNTIIGKGSGNLTYTGTINTSVGRLVLSSLTTGDANSSLGQGSLFAATSGSYNTALGTDTLPLITTGSYNIAIGETDALVGSGNNYTTSESSNIVIANDGVIGDNNTIRIGTQGSGNAEQNTCYIAGIYGVPLSGSSVVVTAGGQLGVGAGNSLTFAGDTGTAVESVGTININTNNAALNAGSSVLVSASGNTLKLNVTDSSNNTIIGKSSGNLTYSGTLNTGVGSTVLPALTTGGSNSVFGAGSLFTVTSGKSNTAVGVGCLPLLDTGNYNIAIGMTSAVTGSGDDYTSNESSNILIANNGVIGDSNTVRIGTSGSGSAQQNKCFIAGIDGVNVGSVARVVTEANNQLGTAILTAGANVTIVPGANTITINASGGGGSGALVLIETQTASNVSGLTFTTGITAGFNNYRIVYDNAFTTTTGTARYLLVQLSDDGGSTYINSGYTIGTNQGLIIGTTVTSSLAVIVTGGCDITNATSGSGYVAVSGSYAYWDTQSGSNVGVVTAGVYTTPNITVDALKIAIDGGGSFSGTFSLYGYTF